VADGRHWGRLRRWWSPCGSTPRLRQALARRASHDHETTSAVIRNALRQYLKVA
jgi:hypothetical protein